MKSNVIQHLNSELEDCEVDDVAGMVPASEAEYVHRIKNKVIRLYVIVNDLWRDETQKTFHASWTDQVQKCKSKFVDQQLVCWFRGAKRGTKAKNSPENKKDDDELIQWTLQNLDRKTNAHTWSVP